MTNTANPLLDLEFAIPFDAIRAEHVLPAIEQLIESASNAIDEITADNTSRTYANTLDALEDATHDLEVASGVIAHIESVATTSEFRAVYQAAQPLLSRFWTGVTLNDALWEALQAFAATEEAKRLDPVSARHLKLTLDDFRRHGAELDAPGKEKLEKINTELSELTTRFAQHVLDATNAFELLIDDETSLAGLPESAKEAARQNAQSRGNDGWRFTLQAPSLIPVLTYLEDAAIRETVWRAHNTRATSGETDNRELVRQILALRREKATLLGFADFSDLVLDSRMTHRGQTASDFVRDLTEKTWSRFERENSELEEFRAKNQPDAGPMKPWDYGYWSEKQRQELFDFDEEELRPYFAADAVMQGVFETVHRLYGVAVEQTTDLPTWNDDVRTYRLLDADGTHLASFYVDLHPREDKRGGAWMNHLITGKSGEPHLGLMCANVNEPVGDKPALLTHREVETIFHEFGHLMHHCLSDVPVRSMAGTNVAWDFVELPSQIMENWCWERESLDTFARHWETNATIPDTLFEKMLNARTYRAANLQMRQLSFATLDLALHREFDPSGDADVMSYSRELMQKFSPAHLPDDYGFITSFSHLFSSPVAYAAGYYSYKWAEVLDADAFTRFKEAGVFDRRTGGDFRTKVLERGDSMDPMEIFVDFMGREPDQTALMVRLGLSESRV